MQLRMRTRSSPGLLVLIALATLLVAGCTGGREASLIGTWKVDARALKMPEAKGGNAQTQAAIAMAKQMLDSAGIELKPDKTFSMSLGAAMEGTWAFDAAASTVTLSITKMAGVDISKLPGASKALNKPLACTLSEDGKRLSIKPEPGRPSPAGGTMSFIKQ